MGRGVTCTWEIWQVDTDGAASGWRGGEARPRSDEGETAQGSSVRWQEPAPARFPRSSRPRPART